MHTFKVQATESRCQVVIQGASHPVKMSRWGSPVNSMRHCWASRETHLYHSSEDLCSCPAQAALPDACALVLQPYSVMCVHILCSFLHSHQGRMCKHCRQSPCFIATHDVQPYDVMPLHCIVLFKSSCVSASVVPVLDSSY